VARREWMVSRFEQIEASEAGVKGFLDEIQESLRAN
jgi:hypothetical protein